MEDNSSFTSVHKKVQEGNQTIRLYLLWDGNTNVNDNQFALMKFASKEVVSSFFAIKKAPFVTIMQYGTPHTINVNNLNNLGQILQNINGIQQTKTNANLDGSLDYIFTQEASQLQDRKIVIIFTNGPMTSQPKIQQMIAKDYDVLCFVVNENANFDLTPVKNIFGEKRVHLFPTIIAMEKFFSEVININTLPPEFELKYSSSSEMCLKVVSEVNYQKYEIHGYIEGASQPILMQETANKKIFLKDLKPNSNYYLKIRGKNANPTILSSFSSEKKLRTIPENPVHLIISDKNKLQEKIQGYRKNLRNYCIPQVLVDVGLRQLNINVIGEIGNGKSSFINTIQTAMQDKEEQICQSVPAGKSQKTYTTKYISRSIWPYTPIQVKDLWGYQFNAEFKGIEELLRGQLRENCEENRVHEANQPLPSPSINTKPHAIILLCDIYSVHNHEKMAKFQELYDKFRQKSEIPTHVVITKLSKVTYEDDKEDIEILEDGLDKIYDSNLINDVVEKFSKETGIPTTSVFLIENYQGENELRDPIKDYLALRLLDQVVTNIEKKFKNSHRIVQVFDQTNMKKGSFLLDHLDISLKEFELSYLGPQKIEGFKPIHYYKRDGNTIVTLEEYDKLKLVDLLNQENSEENSQFHVYQLKVQNEDVKPNFTAIEPNSFVSIDVIDDSPPEPQKCRVKVNGKYTLKNIREKIKLESNLVFSKGSSREDGFFKKSEEGKILALQVINQNSKKPTLHVISENPLTSVIFSCKCGKQVNVNIQSENAKSLREELVAKNLPHLREPFTFFYSDTPPVFEEDESNVDLSELIIEKDDTGKKILIDCQDQSRQL